MTTQTDWDVVVVGCGNAALCAAVAAQEGGTRVLVLERAPVDKRGGNGIFTGGLVRFAYDGLDDLRQLADITEDESEKLDVGRYDAATFYDDVASLGDYLADPDLLDALTSRSFPTMRWLRELGLRFIPSLGMHAHEVNGKIHFRGNAPLEIVGGGLGLVTFLVELAGKRGVEIRYDARAVGLARTDGGRRWRVSVNSGPDVTTTSVVIACGGFEANAAMRAQYLGPGWDLARVRGSEYNTGDGIRLAQGVGAALVGNWSGCHATPTDAQTPRFGDRKLLHTFTRHSYHFGIMVNRHGQRFVDEAQDLETHTYARFGREILRQPGGIAYQIFDSVGEKLLREEYRNRYATHESADTIAELGAKLGLSEAFVRTVEDYNAALTDVPFDPAVKDGKGTRGLYPPKSNWAIPIAEPPFHAFPVVCGITFTYGGLCISAEANVCDEDGADIPGLFAAGEIIGGLFYHNYPTATGITTGAVFGRTAGTGAARHALAARA
jgi:tricarballylate dehydrogenase